MKPDEEARKFFEDQISILKADDPALKNIPDPKMFLVLCLKYYYFQDADTTVDDILDSIVDGADDGSIDAICLERREDPPAISFIQAKYRNTFDVTNALGEISEIKDNAVKLSKQNYSTLNHKVRDRYISCTNETDSTSRSYVYFTSFVPTKKNKKKYLEQLDPTGAEVYFGDDIKSYIEGEQDKTGKVTCGSLELDATGNVLHYQDSCIVNVSAKSLKALYGTYRRALLGLNLRYYIRNKNVDSGIKKTIQNHPEHFWYLNNGIVIACDDYEISGKELKLNSFSIINGGQTTDRIFNTDFDDDFYVLCKVVKTDMSEEDDEDKLTSTSISIASNSQKPIKNKDLVANKPEQIRMKGAMKQNGILYITKAGETIDKKYSDMNKHVSLDTLGKLGLFAITQRPWCRSNSKDLYADDLPFYHIIYSQTTPRLYVDLLKLDNYYKAYSKSKEINDLSNITLARNSRTYILALIVLCSFCTQHPELKDMLRPVGHDLNEKDMTNVISRIKSMDKLIINNLDDEQMNVYMLFSQLNQFVVIPTFEMEKKLDPSLDESNFLKKQDNYYQMIPHLLSNLQKGYLIIQPSVEKLFQK